MCYKLVDKLRDKTGSLCHARACLPLGQFYESAERNDQDDPHRGRRDDVFDDQGNRSGARLCALYTFILVPYEIYAQQPE